MDITGTVHSPWVVKDSNPGQIRCSPGGVARNVAQNLARLDCDTQLLCAVGNDAFGHSLLAHSAAAGVQVHNAWTLSDAATSAYVSLHGSDGDMTVAVNDMDIVQRIAPVLLAPHAKAFQLAKAVVLDCNLTPEALDWICKLEGAAPIFVDAVSAFKCLRAKPVLPFVHTLKLNQLEAAALSSMPCSAATDMQAIAQWLHAQGVHQVVISLGSQGVFWSSKDAGYGKLDALACQVVNTCGAGDALMAGLVNAYVRQLPLQEAAQFAQACAAITVSCEGANHPDLSLAFANNFLPHDTPLS